MSIGRKQRFDGGVGLVDILRVSGQRDPAERSDTPAEERTDIGGGEAGEGKRVLNTFFLGNLADISPIVEHWNIHAPPVEMGRYGGRYRRPRGHLARLGIAGPPVLALREGPDGRKVAGQDSMRGGPVGHEIR